MNDSISRQAAIDVLATMQGLCTSKAALVQNSKIWQQIKDLPSAEPRWIPVTERLPEEDVDVLISYRYREGEGDTRHTKIDITSFGPVYFGGHKVGNHTHWRPPFEYFESNYEVVAWMPLPKPYQEVDHETD